jgi:hypothetical protein
VVGRYTAPSPSQTHSARRHFHQSTFGRATKAFLALHSSGLIAYLALSSAIGRAGTRTMGGIADSFETMLFVSYANLSARSLSFRNTKPHGRFPGQSLWGWTLVPEARAEVAEAAELVRLIAQQIPAADASEEQRKLVSSGSYDHPSYRTFSPHKHTPEVNTLDRVVSTKLRLMQR